MLASYETSQTERSGRLLAQLCSLAINFLAAANASEPNAMAAAPTTATTKTTTTLSIGDFGRQTTEPKAFNSGLHFICSTHPNLVLSLLEA